MAAFIDLLTSKLTPASKNDTPTARTYVRRCPTVAAKHVPLGLTAKGADGNDWTVSSRANGVHFWKKASSPKTSPKTTRKVAPKTSRKAVPKIAKAPKTTTTTKKSPKGARKRSAYNMFVSQNSATIKQRLGDASRVRGAVITECGRQWKALTPVQKKRYQNAADRLNALPVLAQPTKPLPLPSPTRKSSPIAMLFNKPKTVRVPTTAQPQDAASKAATAAERKRKAAERKQKLMRLRGSVSRKLDGERFVLTGKMWASRREVEELLTSHGGTIVTTFSKKNPPILLVGDFGVRGPSSTVAKAQACGATLGNADDLLPYLTETA